MPRYFFDVETAEGEASPDLEGVEFSTEGEAKAYASGLAATLPNDGPALDSDRIVVRNDTGVIVSVVPADQTAPTQPDLSDGL